MRSSRRFKLGCLAILFSFFANRAFADIAEACDVPKKLTFTSIDHPKVRSQIQPLIKKIYAQLGIEIEFLVTASMRDLKLVANGDIMGAAVYSEDIIEGMDGIIRIHPPIVKTSNMLLCQKERSCTEAILHDFDRDKPIAISRAMSNAFLQEFPNFDSKNLLIINEMRKVIELIRSGRVDYGVYPVSDHTNGGLDEVPFDLNSEFLYSVSSYHIISSELQCLEPLVEQVLYDALLSPTG